MKYRYTYTAILSAALLAGCSASAQDIAGTQKTITQAENTLFTITPDSEDYDESYDKNTAVMITCSGLQAEISGSGAETDGENILITAAGTYVITGSFNGTFVVNTTNKGTVHIVLENAEIEAASGAAVNIISADKTIITAYKGTDNTLSDSETYPEGEDAPTAAVYAKDDLVINGSGTLTINGICQNGIQSKDDLYIINTNLNVSAAEDGIKGKDALYLEGSEVEVNAEEGDGIKATNDKDEESGNILVRSGKITVNAGDDAIQAVTYLVIEDGEINVTAGEGAPETISSSMNFPGGVNGGMPDMSQGGFEGQRPDAQSGATADADDENTENGRKQEDSSEQNGGWNFPGGQNGFNGGRPQRPEGGFNGEMPEEGFGGQMPDMPQGGFGNNGGQDFPGGWNNFNGERSDMPEGGFDGQIPENGFGEKMPQMPEEGFNEEMPDMNQDGSEGMMPGTNQDTSGDSSEASAKGIKADGSILILNGNITVNCEDDAFNSDKDLTVENGTLSIACGDDALHADGTLTINDGSVTVSKCKEGLEGFAIMINGGDIDVTAADDGINASDPDAASDSMRADNSSIIINGGNITLTTDGDGIDSNGTAQVAGGTLVVYGPVIGAESALDHNGSFTIDGGTVYGGGSAGMIEVPANTSKSYILCIGTNSGRITISDSSGETVGEYESSKAFSSLIFSSEELAEGETYTVYEDGKEIGSAKITDTVTYINSNGNNSRFYSSPESNSSESNPGENSGPEGSAEDSKSI